MSVIKVVYYIARLTKFLELLDEYGHIGVYEGSLLHLC
jgi:hypothetical protein